MCKGKKERKKFSEFKSALDNATDKEFKILFQQMDYGCLYSEFFYRILSKKSLSEANTAFLKRVALICPEIFIKAIRLQRVAFTSPACWELILSFQNENILAPAVADWVQALDALRKEEAKLWGQVAQARQACEGIPLFDLLVYVSWWYESKRLKEFDENQVPITILQQDIQASNTSTREQARFAVEYFLNYYFHTLKNPKLEGASHGFFAERYLILLKGLTKDKNCQLVFDALELVSNWRSFKSFISTVSFDLNYKLDLSKGVASFSPKSVAKALQWELNGQKYHHLYQYYQEKGYENTEQLLQAGVLKIPKLNTAWGSYNARLNADTNAVDLLVDTLCIKGFDSKNDGHADISIASLIGIMGGFHTNAQRRYTDPTDNLLNRSIWDWRERLTWQAKAAVQNNTFNFSLRWDTLQEWKDILNNKQTTKAELDVLTEILATDYTGNAQKRAFNRFLPVSLSLMATPFIKLDNFVFSFSNIFGELSQSGFAIIESALEKKSNHRKKLSGKETAEMEAKLAQLFKANGISSHLAHSQQYKESTEKGCLSGDIDLMVYESGVLFIIELKRTKLRLNLEAAWLEAVTINHKATQQLEKHKQLLALNPAFFQEKLQLEEGFDFSAVKLVPLIITTSFEDDGEFYGENQDIQKITFYELMKLLGESDVQLMREHKLNPLEELKKMIESRYIWKGLSLPQLKAWADFEEFFPLETAREEDVIRYNRLLKLGAEAYENKQYTTALVHFDELLKINPTSVYLHQSIGNCYSGLKRFQNAQEYYKKGLALISDCHQLMMNNIWNLLDQQKAEEAMEKLLSLLLTYQNVTEVQLLASKHIHYILSMDLLSEAYRKELEEKLSSFAHFLL